jgi:hypothetical protein
MQTRRAILTAAGLIVARPVTANHLQELKGTFAAKQAALGLGGLQAITVQTTASGVTTTHVVADRGWWSEGGWQ